MEESVEGLLPEIDTVKSKVRPDYNKNKLSDITPNSLKTMNTNVNQNLHHKNYVRVQTSTNPTSSHKTNT